MQGFHTHPFQLLTDFSNPYTGGTLLVHISDHPCAFIWNQYAIHFIIAQDVVVTIISDSLLSSLIQCPFDVL